MGVGCQPEQLVARGRPDAPLMQSSCLRRITPSRRLFALRLAGLREVLPDLGTPTSVVDVVKVGRVHLVVGVRTLVSCRIRPAHDCSHDPTTLKYALASKPDPGCDLQDTFSGISDGRRDGIRSPTGCYPGFRRQRIRRRYGTRIRDATHSHGPVSAVCSRAYGTSTRQWSRPTTAWRPVTRRGNILLFWKVPTGLAGTGTYNP